MEVLLDVGGVELVQQLAGLAAWDLAAKVLVVGIAEGELGVKVHFDDGGGGAEEEAEKGAGASDRAGGGGVGAEVPGGGGGFGGGVELADGFDVEARLEAVPDVWAETVAKGDFDVVFLIEVLSGGGIGLRRGCEEVAAGFADILDDGALGGADFGPEGLVREFAAEDEGCADADDGAVGEDGGG